MLEDTRPERPLRRRPAADTPAPMERGGVSTPAEREPQVRESGTERWKRQVEAEARHRLKRCIRGIAARRH
jgi:hypothetical protein